MAATDDLPLSARNTRMINPAAAIATANQTSIGLGKPNERTASLPAATNTSITPEITPGRGEKRATQTTTKAAVAAASAYNNPRS